VDVFWSKLRDAGGVCSVRCFLAHPWSSPDGQQAGLPSACVCTLTVH
jgi:hypothetical protein